MSLTTKENEKKGITSKGGCSSRQTKRKVSSSLEFRYAEHEPSEGDWTSKVDHWMHRTTLIKRHWRVIPRFKSKVLSYEEITPLCISLVFLIEERWLFIRSREIVKTKLVSRHIFFFTMKPETDFFVVVLPSFFFIPCLYKIKKEGITWK